jgi:hypothetical protein
LGEHERITLVHKREEVERDQHLLLSPHYCTNIFNFVHSVILIPKMPNGESRENELGDDQQGRETSMGDLSGGEQLGSRDSVRSRTSHPATMTSCVPHSGGSMAFRWMRAEFNGESISRHPPLPRSASELFGSIYHYLCIGSF